MHIGENIKKIRKQKGLSQKDLAQKIELDVTQLNRIETGKSEPSLKNLKLMAEVLEVSLDNIVYGYEQPEEEVLIENKSLSERLKLIDSLSKEDKEALVRIIDIVLTKHKFTNFFEQQLSN